MDGIDFKGAAGLGHDYAAFASADDAGLTQRQYAAMLLRVPDSGLPWLDEMIKRARVLDIEHAMNIHGAMMDLTTKGASAMALAINREFDKMDGK